MIRLAHTQDFEKIKRLWQEVTLPSLTVYQIFVFIDKHQLKGFICVDKNNKIQSCFSVQTLIRQKLIKYIQRRKNCLSLHIKVQNKPEIQFYHTQGFKIIQQISDIHSQDAYLLMCWSLGCPTNRFVRLKEDS